MRADWVRYDGEKQISPALAYVEREDPSSGIFASTHFLACLVGHVINIHDNIMYTYNNMVEGKSVDGDTHAEISGDNVLKVTKEQLSDDQKQQLARTVEGFEDACL